MEEQYDVFISYRFEKNRGKRKQKLIDFEEKYEMPYQVIDCSSLTAAQTVDAMLYSLAAQVDYFKI